MRDADKKRARKTRGNGMKKNKTWRALDEKHDADGLKTDESGGVDQRARKKTKTVESPGRRLNWRLGRGCAKFQ